MQKLKEVTVYTDGDSSEISTWSNVPYFLTEALISKGIKVNRVNIKADSLLEEIYHKTIYYLVKVFNRGTTYTYIRTYIHFKQIRKRIQKSIKQYPNADADIFLTFSFSSVGFTNKTIVQFCDWTYDHYFNYFANRKPDFLEKQCIKREDSQIKGADFVFPLFPSVADYMKKRYGNNKVFYLGNVINSLHHTLEINLDVKQNLANLLFVGSNKYIEGAKTLIGAFKKIKSHYPQSKLHIIGIDSSEFEELPEDVYCYGYLDKGKDIERELYYKLLKEATIFINTTPKWGAFSASIETMYYYTPVIVTPYDEFSTTFGEKIHFGCYCEENTESLIEEKIMEILNHTDYKELCQNAHDVVKEFTWEAYIDKIIQKIEEKMNTN